MTETGWQVIGRIAKDRRERLGLNQDQLAQYGGPRVATVGKFERAAQASFPLRTQHQVEKALGWSRGIIEQVVRSVDEGRLTAADWEHDLVEEGIPDLSHITVVPPDELGVAEAVESFVSVFRLVPADQQSEALRAAIIATLDYLDTAGAERLGRGMRASFPPRRGGDGDADAAGGSAPTNQDKYELAADERETTIEAEQEGDEFP